MASFIEDLWNSIFTPGPTPPLIVATNAAFAGLQLILLALLVATFSIHFVVLSVLCAGLWFSINWFAKEVSAVQAREEQEKRRAGAGTATQRGGGAAGDPVDSGDDTETEVTKQKAASRTKRVQEPAQGGETSFIIPAPDEGTAEGVGTGSSLQAGALEDVRKRRSLTESTGDISTDSEWEKVEEEK